MNKYIGVLATSIALTTMSGCSSMSKNTHASATAALDAEPAQIITRPTEYAYKTIGTASGKSTRTKILMFTIDGDATKASVKGAFGSSDLEKLAAYRAVKSLDGDAFFKLSTEVNESGFWPFYSKKDIRVTGKVLKIDDLGTLTQKRSDALLMGDDE